MGYEGRNLLIDCRHALLVDVDNRMKFLWVLLDYLCIDPGGKTDVGLVVFQERICSIIELAIKGLFGKDLVQDALDEIGGFTNNFLTYLMELFLFGV